MTDLPDINRTLLTILENQVARCDAALVDLDDDSWNREPGGDCNSIARIGRHLIMLRWFQLTMLESPLSAELTDLPAVERVEDVRAALATAAALVHQAITEHDPTDWYHTPEPPRPGKWGDEPTINRFTRPMNDFTNHLGAIRALRRQFGHSLVRTQ